MERQTDRQTKRGKKKENKEEKERDRAIYKRDRQVHINANHSIPLYNFDIMQLEYGDLHWCEAPNNKQVTTR